MPEDTLHSWLQRHPNVHHIHKHGVYVVYSIDPSLWHLSDYGVSSTGANLVYMTRRYDGREG